MFSLGRKKLRKEKDKKRKNFFHLGNFAPQFTSCYPACCIWSLIWITYFVFPYPMRLPFNVLSFIYTISGNLRNRLYRLCSWRWVNFKDSNLEATYHVGTCNDRWLKWIGVVKNMKLEIWLIFKIDEIFKFTSLILDSLRLFLCNF